jgi:allantoate deiminase
MTLHAFGPDILRLTDELAAISETPGALTRVYLSPEQRRASDLVLGWMKDAGMSAGLDAVGNVVGRYEGERPGAPALMLGSHLDTVRDAGRYDGMLGVVVPILCVKALAREGRRLPFAIEVVGFADEEGVRFQSTLIGSRAVAGIIDPKVVLLKDANGVSLGDAMRAFGLDPGAIAKAARRREDILAYVEIHIEQGPVLEARGLALGVVTSIAGAARLQVELAGMAGHAGTVPMNLRQDALAGAAECVLAVERRCKDVDGLVGTVGKIEALPGAINVIPGAVRFTLDVRAGTDSIRRAAVADILKVIDDIAVRRKLGANVVKLHENDCAACAPWLMDQIGRAVTGEGVRRFDLPSGAGHDGMAMIALADIGMLFVRCKAGISHNPAEAITLEDAEIGARALLRFIRDFQPRDAKRAA